MKESPIPNPLFVDKVRQTITRYAMIAPGQAVVVGVSGGQDSVALLYALRALQAEWGGRLVVAHLNHGFRGQESDEDAAFTQALAERWGLECHCERSDVPEKMKRRKLSAQEAAREARHAFLRRVAEETDAERIALGHTQDDRVETILLNLLRGSGIEGLAGFPPVRPPIIRPLYDVTRAETEACCRAIEIEPRHDSSNAKTDYRRNRTREELLPYLRTYYNAKADAALLRMAELAAADNHVLETLATEACQEIFYQETADEIVLERDALLRRPIALQRRVLRQAIERLRGHLHGVEYAILEGALHAFASKSHFSADLPQEDAALTRLVCDNESIHLIKVKSPQSPTPWREIIHISQETRLSRADIILSAQIYPAGSGELTQAFASYRREELREAARKAHILCFPLAALTEPIVARSWRPGDRLRIRNVGGKKIQDLFTDVRVPVAERMKVPILVDKDGDGCVLAVIGLRADECAIPLEEASLRASQEDMLVVIAKKTDCSE